MAFNKKIVLLAGALMIQLYVLAQNAGVTEADSAGKGFMRSEGKIYVAMTVSLTILIGLIIFLWRLDRKIGRLEKEG